MEHLDPVAVDRDWSIGDVLDANDALDYFMDLDTWQRGPLPPPTKSRP